MEYPRGTIQEFTLNSEALGEEMTLLVYLPASYTPLYKYSVLIAQDGRDYFQLGRIGRLADELLANEEIENMIIVGVPYKSVNDRRRKYHPEGEQHQAYIRFLAHELVTFLDQEFPTYQMGKGRALIGDSLAATVSLMAALDYPHTFGKVILQSPFVNETVLTATSEFSDPSLLGIYHTVGLGETDVTTTAGKKEDFLSPNRELSKILKKRFNAEYEEFNGNHTWTYWQPDLRKALKSMFS
ncbi:alpha/beta hydrolase [Mesobacillus zeae]|uniref:Esterase family protein n=1 Tax=Mesobacillus zeae TaxID=1917180 RepID=A0A398B2K8_9BACI|nr:alpha/beta hydrolase-fold protein [Mesobacillus zeae]RID82026.1 esterase family protein [Mesobacillus zeae]